ncbi:Putative auto-transporter adhesin, head GIN domain [Salegentibacter holothuriorum]|uniref:Putative auto-transporter adhesin, head GIN domain n=1 Tax=Salegentibacter holothuriorum TaxID=241145 RepID=A0A1T5EDX9_9FLAO|nr:head GIN domain-containing protein [Salegentibacter holothuriorum]SKB82069.1 Putative auto-transporter adhesin, head GIN domain [Salegentibacter holothuriorum]
MKNLLLIFSTILLVGCGAKKITGSGNVTTEKNRLTDFNSIEIAGDFDVKLKNGNTAMIEIEADDNLHSIIRAEVVDRTLFIKPSKEIGRSKSKDITITYPEKLQKITISGKVELEAEGELYSEELKITSKENAELYLTITATKFDLFNEDDAKIELNLTAENVYFQLNGSSDIKALVNAPIFKVDTYEKADAKIEGEVDDLQLRAEHSSKFDGKRLTAKTAVVIAEGKSKNEIEVLETLTLTAKNRSEIELYGNPKVELLEFSEKAVLSKKD